MAVVFLVGVIVILIGFGLFCNIAYKIFQINKQSGRKYGNSLIGGCTYEMVCKVRGLRLRPAAYRDRVHVIFPRHPEDPRCPCRDATAVGSQLQISGIIELSGGLAVRLGFQTRVAAFLSSSMMAVAYFQFDWKFQLGPMLFPVINKGELAVLYCFLFLFIACRGGIKWCLDKKG